MVNLVEGIVIFNSGTIGGTGEPWVVAAAILLIFGVLGVRGALVRN